jgi:Restriction endonuclease
MKDKSLSDLVSDWGGFERLVAKLHETGNVSVEHNVILPGRSGAPRQIDVLVRHTEGLYEHLIVVECKYRSSAVERLHVDALATTIREVGAARGVIFSTQGFQSGAIEQAKHENISLYQLREPTDAEWGLPGRKVDIWLHCISISIGNFEIPGATAITQFPGRPITFNLAFDETGPTSQTPIKVEGKPDTTLETLIVRIARGAVPLVYKPIRVNFDGTFNGVVKNVIRMNFNPDKAAEVFMDGAKIFVPCLSFSLGIKITQTRFEVDRATPYAFVLAVQDCVKNTVTTASRRTDDDTTQLNAIQRIESTEAVFESGSLISVFIKPFEQFSEFDGVAPGQGPEIKMKLEL